ILEERRRRGPIVRRCGRLSGHFIDLIHTIGPGVWEQALFAATPTDLNLQVIRHAARRKNPDRVIARQIPSTAHHFLTLRRYSTSQNAHLRSDTARVAALAFEADGDARHIALVAKNGRRPV